MFWMSDTRTRSGIYAPGHHEWTHHHVHLYDCHPKSSHLISRHHPNHIQMVNVLVAAQKCITTTKWNSEYNVLGTTQSLVTSLSESQSLGRLLTWHPASKWWLYQLWFLILERRHQDLLVQKEWPTCRTAPWSRDPKSCIDEPYKSGK